MSITINFKIKLTKNFKMWTVCANNYHVDYVSFLRSSNVLCICNV